MPCAPPRPTEEGEGCTRAPGDLDEEIDEAGIGKTALLEYARKRARAATVVETTGVESELELPFAGLADVLRPLLGHLDELTESQQELVRRCTSTTTRTKPSTSSTENSSSSSVDERIEAGPGDFLFAPQGVPHAYVTRSEQAEFLATFAPASMDRFLEELGGAPVVHGEPPPAVSYPDPEEFARGAAKWGVEIIGPPPILD
jgi:hypothetical protein